MMETVEEEPHHYFGAAQEASFVGNDAQMLPIAISMVVLLALLLLTRQIG